MNRLVLVLATLLLSTSAWGRYTASESKPENGVRSVHCLVSTKDAWKDSWISYTPGVYEYMMSLDCRARDDERMYCFKFYSLNERCDSSLLLIKLKSGEVVKLVPSYYMQSNEISRYSNAIGDIKEFKYTEYYLRYPIEKRVLNKMITTGIVKMRIGGSKLTSFDEYTFKNDELSKAIKNALSEIDKRLALPYQPDKTIFDDF